MKVDHLGIVVPDLDAAIAFYRDALKCKVTAPVVRHGQGIKKAFVCFENMQVELIAPTTPESPIKDVLEHHNASDYIRRHPDGGLHHVCYSVPDLEEARDALRGKGYRMLGAASTAIGAANQPIVFLDPAGTDGVLIELKQDSAGN
ncbi:MAG: VOC family protein [Hyphomicrobiales bacterium]|nr:VOC family protein [Hyphomicrobiales bacterium]